MGIEYELYKGAYTGAEIDAAIAASITHLADSDIHLTSAQATKIANSILMSDAFGSGTNLSPTSSDSLDSSRRVWKRW